MYFEKVRDALAAQFELDPEKITMETNLIDDLGADSLDVVELIMNIEDAQIGRPLCSAVTISSLSGYILCENADLDVAASPTEKDAILSYMNGGFYYE